MIPAVSLPDSIPEPAHVVHGIRNGQCTHARQQPSQHRNPQIGRTCNDICPFSSGDTRGLKDIPDRLCVISIQKIALFAIAAQNTPVFNCRMQNEPAVNLPEQPRDAKKQQRYGAGQPAFLNPDISFRKVKRLIFAFYKIIRERFIISYSVSVVVFHSISSTS